MGVLDTVIAAGQRELGTPYVYGGTGPTGFDCSGLTQYAYKQAGISIPRTSEQQQGFAVATASPVPGDLVFWGNPAYHVAIYLGNGKILAAPHTGTLVQVEDIYGSPTFGHVAAAGTQGTATGGLSGVTNPAADTAATGSSIKSFATESVFVVAGLAVIGVGIWRTGVPQKIGKGVASGVSKVGMVAAA
jgi:cell wall-associated NlpC family hydrolase